MEITMGNLTPRCALCARADVKKRLFGGVTMTCKGTEQRVAPADSCGDFVMDPRKKLAEAGFGDHVYGSPEHCLFCKHLRVKGSLAHVAGCGLLNVPFPPDYQPGDHVCDYFESFI